MKIKEITVSNGYAVHLSGAPTNEAYFEVRARLDDGDDVDACTKELQERCEAGLAQHAQKIRDIYAVNRKIAEDKKREEQAQEQARLRESMRQGSDIAESMRRGFPPTSYDPTIMTATEVIARHAEALKKYPPDRWPKDVKYLNPITGDPLSPAEIDRLERFDKDVLQKL